MTFSEVINHPYLREILDKWLKTLDNPASIPLSTPDVMVRLVNELHRNPPVYVQFTGPYGDVNTIGILDAEVVPSICLVDLVSDGWEFVDNEGNSIQEMVDLKYPPAPKTVDLFD